MDTFLGESEFEDALLPLSMIATDIATGDKVIMDNGPVSSAVMASTAIPGVFAPVERDGRLLVDGGVWRTSRCHL